MEIAVMTDGASHKNGGMCGIGVHIIDAETKKILLQVSECVGEGTNSHAEYSAFIRGIYEALNLAQDGSITKVMLLADSNLVVQQVSGDWKVASNLREYVDLAKSLVAKLKSKVADVVIDHIPREYNTRADELSTQAVDKAVSKNIEKKYPFLSL